MLIIKLSPTSYDNGKEYRSLYDQLKQQQQQQGRTQDQPLIEIVSVISTSVSLVMSNDNRKMFLYEDLSLSFHTKFTITGICSIVFNFLSIVFEVGGLANGYIFR
jgi:hypothetical protein